MTMEDKQFYLSAELTCRLAAIDIGSNSVRLLVAEALRGGAYRILDEEREPTRLGRAIASRGALDEESMEQTIAALRTFKQIAAGFQTTAVKTIATCAVREARNGSEFCKRVREEVGLEVEVISADREARLAFSSIQNAFHLIGKNVILADIGGGSTEIVFATGNLIEAIFTTPLGAVRLTEQHGLAEAHSPEAYQRLEEEINACLKKRTSRPLFAPHFLIGSGGTFTALAELVMAARKQTDVPVAGFEVSQAEVRHLLDRLRKTPPKARRGMAGMAPDRADIILAGISIVDALLKRFHVNTLVIHTRGVRDGLVREMIDDAMGTALDDPAQREDAIDRLAVACSGEAEHGRKVAALAARIYEQLCEPFKLDPADRIILETAARLQDVGYVINYEQHHKHSYHLIRNSRLPGVVSQDLELIANVARYHRGAHPKRKHENLSRLSAEDQERVARLASILRIAGGLDRSRSQQVRDVLVRVEAEQIVLEVVATEEPTVDMWGAQRRIELFEEVFGITPEIVWASQSVLEKKDTKIDEKRNSKKDRLPRSRDHRRARKDSAMTEKKTSDEGNTSQEHV